LYDKGNISVVVWLFCI